LRTIRSSICDCYQHRRKCAAVSLECSRTQQGYIRLALTEGVPIIPVVSAGAHDGWWVLSDGRWLSRLLHTHRFVRTDVLPITLSVPWGLTVGAPPYLPLPTQIILEVLEPIEFERSGPEAADDREYVETCHRRVLETMQLALDGLVQERRTRRGRLFRAIGSA
jgi:hypothetical protein